MTQSASSKILIITLDRLGELMAGPAIRAWEMANHLGQTHDVRLLGRGDGLRADHFQVSKLSRSSLKEAIDWADVIIFQGYVLHLYPEIASQGKVVICDIYDPMHLESLEMNREEEQSRRLALAISDMHVINEQLRSCDYFICASEKQRDFWLGQLSAVGRVNPWTYDEDPSLRRLIDIAPFGISPKEPVHEKDVLRGVVPGIGTDDRILIWGGGIYDWFDPLTVIRAVHLIKDEFPDLRLYFMGVKHPNPEVPQMRLATKAIELTRELGLEGKHVFFNYGWIPYQDRANYLMEADIGISCHFEHIEASYSYRTRVLDYFWATLPVVVTQGDAMGDVVERHELGLTVAPEDVEGFADALRTLLRDPEFASRCRSNIEQMKPDLAWTRAFSALDAFCSTARRSPDLLAGGSRPSESRWFRPFRLIGRVLHYWKGGGWELVRVQTRRYFRRATRIK